MSEGKWIYNSDEEVWMNCEHYDTKEEAIQAGKEDYEGDSQFFVGQIKNMNIGVGVDADRILDDIAENVYDEVGEAAEDYLGSVRKDELSELEDLLNDALRQWMDKHDYKPKYFSVENIESIPLSE